MSSRSPQLLLMDMQEAIEKIQRYVDGIDRESFISDEKTSDAVVRNLEVIGEAANRLPEEFRAQHAHIEWRKIIGLRHRIVHDYFGVDLHLVWQIILSNLPEFADQIAEIIQDD